MSINCKRVLLYVLLFLMIVIGLFFTIIGGMFFTTAFNTKSNGCKNPPSTPLLIAHRGDTSVSQENTVKAGLSAVKKGYGTEFDIFILTTGEAVLFHDENAKDTTGVDLQIENSTWDEFSKLKLNKTLYNVTYNQEESPALLKDYLQAVCEFNPNSILNFDIKFDHTEDNFKKVLDIFDNSNCNCQNLINYYIFSTPYPWKIPVIRNSISKAKCNNIKVNYYVHPGTYPGGEYFWLKTRFFINLWSPDTINIEYQIINRHPEILSALNEDGFCTSTYANTEDYLKNFDVKFAKVIDLSPASKNTDVYEYNSNTYKALIAMTTVGVVMLFAGLVLFILICCNCICVNKNVSNKDNLEKVEKIDPESNPVIINSTERKEMIK
jgi:glycerophosphoryl diester phosphodiesterase